MTLDVTSLGSLLCERLCQEIRLDERPDGALLLRTNFEFPDGDRFPVHISEVSPGGVRLSDKGHTLMHLSYEHDVDLFLSGRRGVLLERIMAESGLEWDEGGFRLDTPISGLPDAIFRFGQGLTRIHDLSFLNRKNVKSTFYDELATRIREVVEPERVTKDYAPEELEAADAYRVDYRIRSEHGPQLFLFGVPNRDKARLATIMLAHFHRNNLQFNSLIVFESQPEIPRLDLARLTDVGGEMISSLTSGVALRRKIKRLAA